MVITDCRAMLQDTLCNQTREASVSWLHIHLKFVQIQGLLLPYSFAFLRQVLAIWFSTCAAELSTAIWFKLVLNYVVQAGLELTAIFLPLPPEC